MNKKILKNIGPLIIFMGIMFIIIGSAICLETFDYSDKVDTVGIITDFIVSRNNDGTNTYTTKIAYSVDGVERESILSSYSSADSIGSEKQIYYDINNPSLIGSKSSDLFVLVFLVVGLIILIIGIVITIVSIKRRKMIKRLKQSGRAIYATYSQTIINQSISVNGVHPYIIICQWLNPMDNKVYSFKSENIFDNPDFIIQQRNITHFKVYIDENNLQNYVVDIDILEQNV